MEGSGGVPGHAIGPVRPPSAPDIVPVCHLTFGPGLALGLCAHNSQSGAARGGAL